MTVSPISENNQRGPIAWMAGNSVATNLLMLLFLIGGFFVYSNSTKEVFPEFSLDWVNVDVVYPGASPAEVEKGIILALEDAVNSIEGIGEVNATAFEGSARVSVEVLDADDTIKISQDIKNAVDRIQSFPDEAEEPIVSIPSHKRNVLRLVLYGPADERVLREAADLLMDTFTQSADIGPVELIGARDFEIHIEISQAQLRRYGLTLSDVAAIIRSTALELPGGKLETQGGDLMVRLQERRENARDFANIPIVTTSSGANVMLSDIATIRDTFEDSNRFAIYNGMSAIVMEVHRIGEQSPVGVASATRAELNKLKNIMPADIEVAITSDQSITYSQRADLMLKNGLWGLMLVILFLSLFLDMRLAFWVSMGIPISFAGAFLFFPLTDFTLNMVTMFAFIISLGIVVDDAIVVGESVYTFRERGHGPLEASVLGAQEVALPIIFSILTNIAAFMPFFFVSGFMGKIFSVIPVVVVSVFLVSLIECLFILPEHLHLKRNFTLSWTWLRKLHAFQQRFNKGFREFVERDYRQLIELCLARRYLVVVTAVSLLIVTIAYIASGRMGLTMFPSVEADYAYASITYPAGAPKQQLQQGQYKLEQAAKQVVADNGGDDLARGVYSIFRDNLVETYVYLTNPEVRPINTQQFTGAWRKAVGSIADAEALSFQSNRGGPGSGAALTVELSHRDVKTLEAAAIELGEAIADYPTTSDIDDGTAQGKRQFDFVLNDYGRALGLTASLIASQTRAAFQGIEVLKQQQGRNEVTVRLRLPINERSSQSDFENLLIRTTQGEELLLSDVVNIEEGRSYTSIKRRDGRRMVRITADVEPRQYANQITQALEKTELLELQQRFPGLSYSFEGHQADMRDSVIGLVYGLVFVQILIFGLLAMLFRSYTQPLIIMSVIPFSIIGVVLGHELMGYSLSVVSMFGFLALTGVVVNDSLILVDYANRQRSKDIAVEEAIVLAGIRRFRPIVLTTLTTFIGLMPILLETSRQARFLIPMAISLGFGILFATLVTLILVPVFYIILRDIKNLFAKFFHWVLGGMQNAFTQKP